jgi:N-acetylneuraminic acid mutarotase
MKRTKEFSTLIVSTLLILAALTTSSQAFAQGGTWTSLAPLPTPRVGVASAAVNGQLYVISGSNTSLVEVYNPLTNSWGSAAPIPTNRAYAQAGVINGQIYVLGGCINSDCSSGVTNVLERYDPVSNTWAALAPMPTVRTSFAVGVINGKLYVVGGWTFCAPCGLPIPDLDVYDPVTNTWASKAPTPTAVGGPGGGVINGKFYLVGGRLDNVTAVGTLQVYDPSTDTWTTQPSMPTARYALGAGVVNGILYAVSGNDSAQLRLITVEAYDPVSNNWTTVAPIPAAAYQPTPATINEVMYVAGNVGGVTVEPLQAFTPIAEIGPPTDKDQCKKNGWQTFNVPRMFKNQGDCVSFVNTGK